MFWCVISGLLVGLIFFLLFAPFRLSLNSVNNLYFVSFGWLLKVSISLLKDDVEINYNLFGFNKTTTFLELLAKRKRKKSIPEIVTEKVVETTKKRVPFDFFVDFLRSFHIKRFFLNIDLGSVYYNAWLYPLGEIFKSEKLYCTTNFEGKTDIDIEIFNRPIHMILAIVKTHVKIKRS